MAADMFVARALGITMPFIWRVYGSSLRDAPSKRYQKGLKVIFGIPPRPQIDASNYTRADSLRLSLSLSFRDPAAFQPFFARCFFNRYVLNYALDSGVHARPQPGT